MFRKKIKIIIMMMLIISVSEIRPQLPNLILTDTTITTVVSFTHPNSITAGPNFIIASTGDATFITGGQIYLRSGVSVALGGIFKTVLDTTLVGVENDDGNKLPHEFTLQQNYPNPFNPVTTIRFEVPYDSRIRLTIYDVLGNMVAELVNENLAAGNYNFSWNAQSLPSGVYFYTLTSESFNATKKLVLLK